MTDKEKIAFSFLEIAHNLQVNDVNMSWKNADVLYNLIKNQENQINRYQTEIERLNKEVDRLSQCVLYHEGQIVDAVKDFAERLKEEFRLNTDNNGDINSCLVPIIIDNLVNQITESEE